MGKVSVSRAARASIAEILAASRSRWGPEGRRRYEALFAAAFRQLAASLSGPLVAQRNDLPGDLHDFHLRRTIVTGSNRVRSPVHVIYYHSVPPDLINVVAVLDERMDSRLHLDVVDPE